MTTQLRRPIYDNHLLKKIQKINFKKIVKYLEKTLGDLLSYDDPPGQPLSYGDPVKSTLLKIFFSMFNIWKKLVYDDLLSYNDRPERPPSYDNHLTKKKSKNVYIDHLKNWSTTTTL